MPYYIKKKSGQKKKSELRTWINKLDKAVSLYVRMRDSKEYHYKYFRCISCGRVLPVSDADCGHYVGRAHMSLRFDTRNVNAECRYCLTPDMRILTADLRWMPLSDVQVGDEIFAFDEESHGKKSENRRQWRKGVITHLHEEIQEVYDVELENGDHIKTTAEHKWLVRGRGGRGCCWMATKDMWVKGYNLSGKRKTGPHTKITTTVLKPFLTVEHEKSYESGWLAGMLDADGHLCQQNIHNPDGTIRYGLRVGIAQSEKYPQICKEIIKWLEYFTDNRKPCRQSMENSNKKNNGIISRVPAWQYLVTGTNVEKIQFLMRIRPNKMSKLNIDKIGKVRSKYDTKVKSITPLGKKKIVVMETSTHTFIAEGYMMHNCNRFSSSHLIGYRQSLVLRLGNMAYKKKYPNMPLDMQQVKRLGEQQVTLLEYEGRQTKKWSVFELQQLYIWFSKQVIAMRDEMGGEK